MNGIVLGLAAAALALASPPALAAQVGSDELVRRGEELLDAGAAAAARAAFLAAIEADPRSERARLGCAEAVTRLGDLEGAAAVLLAGLGVAGDSVRLHVAAGRTLEQLGRRVEAAAHLERAIALDPESADARLSLGLFHLRHGDLGTALDHLERCVALDPRSLGARHNLAIALSRAGRLDDALESYRAALAIDRSEPKVHYGLGVCLEQLGRLDEAATALTGAILLDQSFAAAHYRLAAVSLRRGKKEDGLRAMRRFRELKAEGHFQRGETALEDGDAAGAIREYERALDAHPALVDAHARLGRLYLQTRDGARALLHARAAAKLDPRALRFANVAFVCLRAGRREEALTWIDRALDEEPGKPEYVALREEILRHEPRAK